LGQTYRGLEVIVVGDCSTDDTEERLKRLDDGRIKFLNLAKREEYPADSRLRWMVAGTKAMNTALSVAAGDFITHLDDDDEYLPTRIEELVACALRNCCDFIWHPFWWEIRPEEWILNEAESFDCGKVTTSSVFYRSWFKNIGWDQRAYLFREPGDWNRFRRIKLLSGKCMRYPKALVKHYKERSQDEYKCDL
jgi:glycosyltransferase involved in cell wall biosynthesis